MMCDMNEREFHDDTDGPSLHDHTKFVNRIPKSSAHPEDYCQRCNHRMRFNYAATNECWNKVVGDEDNPCGDGHIICVDCFIELCQEKSIEPEFAAFHIPGSKYHLEIATREAEDRKRSEQTAEEWSEDIIKGATEVAKALKFVSNRVMLRKFWDSLMDDGGLLYDRDQYIDTFMKERDAD